MRFDLKAILINTRVKAAPFFFKAVIGIAIKAFQVQGIGMLVVRAFGVLKPMPIVHAAISTKINLTEVFHPHKERVATEPETV